MAWLASHDTLEDHPKLERLSEITGEPMEVCFYRLHCLWKRALAYQPDGDLGKLSDTQVARWARWPVADAATFVQALMNCGDRMDKAGFLDRDRKLHDWAVYAGPWLSYLREKEADRKRKAKAKQPELPVESPPDIPPERRQDIPPETPADVPLEKAAETPSEVGRNSAGVSSRATNKQTNKPTKQKAFGEAAVETAEVIPPERAAPSAPKAENSEGKKQNAESSNGPEKQHGTRSESGTATGPVRTDAPGIAGTADRTAPKDSATASPAPAAVVQPAGRTAGPAGNGQQRARGAGTSAPPVRDSALNPAKRYQRLGYALRKYGSDEHARRLIGWLLEKFPYALDAFDLQVLARYLASKAMADVQDPAAYVIGWSENADASHRGRPPFERYIQDAKEKLFEADGAMQRNGRGHTAWMDDLVKAWTKDAKPKETAGVGA